MKLAVVIAAYNERENIGPLTQRLIGVLRALSDWSWEIIYVVDGDDGTDQVVARLSADLHPIRLSYQAQPNGLANAFRRGFAIVPPDSDFVLTMDADLNHQPEEIPRLLQEIIATGSDIVIGSRFVRGSRIIGMPLWKRLVSRSINSLMGVLFDLDVRDKTSGFRVYKAGALRSLEFDNSGFAFLPEILLRASAAGLSIIEEPIHFIYRVQGTSKMNLWKTSKSYLSLLYKYLKTKASRG